MADNGTEKRWYYKCGDCFATVCLDSQPIQPTCAVCGGIMRLMGEVRGTHDWTRTEKVCVCNEACVDASGPDCSCACGGINHGIGMKGYVEVDMESGKIVVTPPDHTNVEKHRQIAAEYRAARDTAKARLEAGLAAKYGDLFEQFKTGNWVDDKGAWWQMTLAYKAYRDAINTKVQKLRLAKLAKIGA